MDSPDPLVRSLKCPECGGLKNWKDGVRPTENGDVQRYLCRSCGFRFSEHLVAHENLLKNVNPLRMTSETLAHSQICAHPRRGAKILVKMDARIEKAAGATKHSDAEIKGKLLEYSWFMKRQGYPESTISGRTRLLRLMARRGASLWNPELVKDFIARQDTWSNGQKTIAVYAYSTFLKMEKLTWEPPKYKKTERIPHVPLGKDIDTLIKACGRKVSVFLQALKETGADPGEFIAVEWSDVNEERKTLTINHPVKGHNPRILPISRNLIDRFQLLPKESVKVFPMTMTAMRSNFSRQRKRKARAFSNPRLLKVSFTSIRHWKATTEYHKTRDILHVKRLLGHKKLDSTMVYIDVERAIYGTEEDVEYVSRVASSLKGARALIDAGYEYVTDLESYKLFRKKKK